MFLRTGPEARRGSQPEIDMNVRDERVAAASTSAAEPFAREVFRCEASDNEMIEIVVSIASVPLVGPPPRPRHFGFEVVTPAGASFEVRGAPGFEAAVPLVGPPPNNN